MSPPAKPGESPEERKRDLPAPYQMCTRCVMDTTDPAITFDEGGVCAHCRGFNATSTRWHRGDSGRVMLESLAATMRNDGAGSLYDVAVGVSGGVDSSYLLHLLSAELGLRVLAVHVDAGWNTELAVANIEKIVNKLGIELFTHVIDWEEMADLQLAYLRSGLANQDVPQDHIFPAEVLRATRTMKVRHIANGSNIATESILPAAWGYNAADARQLLAVHKRFGTKPLKTYRVMGFLTRFILERLSAIQISFPLNYTNYSKVSAMKRLEEEYGWTYYGGKHYESRWTRFFQSYYLTRRFGFDKRKAHLSSLIVTGELTREKALEELRRPPYDPQEIEGDITFVCRKLGIERHVFESIVQQPAKDWTHYPNDYANEERFRRLVKLIKSVKEVATPWSTRA